jgi:hypothetical protein
MLENSSSCIYGPWPKRGPAQRAGEDTSEFLEAASLMVTAVIGCAAGLVLDSVAPAAAEPKRLFSLSVSQAA